MCSPPDLLSSVGTRCFPKWLFPRGADDTGVHEAPWPPRGRYPVVPVPTREQTEARGGSAGWAQLSGVPAGHPGMSSPQELRPAPRGAATCLHATEERVPPGRRGRASEEAPGSPAQAAPLPWQVLSSLTVRLPATVSGPLIFRVLFSINQVATF